MLGACHGAPHRAPRVPPRRLPPLLLGPAGGADWHVDADGGPVVAGPPAHAVAVQARADRLAPVRADPALLHRVARARGPRAQAAAARRHPGRPGLPGPGAGSPRGVRSRGVLARRRAGLLLGARPPAPPVAPAFIMNGLGFAVAVIMLLGLRTQGAPRERSGGGVLDDVRAGLRYAFRTPEIRLTLGLLFIVSICVFNFTVYVPLVVRTVLHLGAEGFGLLMACLGAGAVTGALTVGALGARRPPAAA